MVAKRFFYVCAGLLCLALALPATPRSAQAGGRLRRTFGTGSGQLQSPRAGAVGAGGCVYVADQSDSKLPQATIPSSVPQVAGEPPGEPSPQILKACRRINPESLLRMRGDFGEFQGYASQVGPRGLDGLQAHPTDGSLASPPGPVTWDRIERIEKRGGSAGIGALFGAVLLGLIGYGMGSALEDTGDIGAAPGAAVGVAGGAGLGGLFGAAIPRWHLVYEGPFETPPGRAAPTRPHPRRPS